MMLPHVFLEEQLLKCSVCEHSARRSKKNADNLAIETKQPGQNNKKEDSTTKANTTYDDDDALAYYHQSTSQFQPSKPMVRRRSHVRKTTFSLFLISLAFVLSYLPTLLLLLMRSINSEFEANLTDTERAVYKFFIRICWLNCAMNPFLLALSGSRFRAHCNGIVSQCWQRLTCKA